MKKTLLFLILFVAACGSDDVLNPIDREQVTVQLPDGQIIPAVEVRPPTEEEIAEPEEEYPEGYCESDLWVYECWLNSVAIATGPGCLKNITLLFGDDAEEYCEE